MALVFCKLAYGTSTEEGIILCAHLYVPLLIIKREEMNAYVAIQFNNVFENGTDAEVALSRVGVKGMNICKGAFRERGYGEWKDLSDAT